MRKVKIILPILILFIGILLYLQFGRNVEVISTTSTTSDQFYEQGMTVVANKLIIPDKVAFAENLLDRTRRNDFKEVLFSYDVLGYPDRIKITVYPNRICMKLCRGSWNIEYENGEIHLQYPYQIVDKGSLFFKTEV